MSNLNQQIKNRLLSEFSFKENGDWLQNGKCPLCGQKELYTSAITPYSIKCGRENKCRYNSLVKDLYPEYYQNYNEIAPATKFNSNATADYYLKNDRGLDISKIRGWYRQGSYCHPKGDKKTSTVIFDIDKDNDIYMERFIENVLITDEDGSKTLRKANFKGKFGGSWWQPPNFEVNDGDEIWITEGVIDAISLNIIGKKAVSSLSCSNWPQKNIDCITSKKITFILALDNDPAGKKYTSIYYNKLTALGFTVQVAFLPEKKYKFDWNDAYKKGLLSEENFVSYIYNGKIFLAKSPYEKGVLLNEINQSNFFVFSFRDKLYSFEIKTKEGDDSYPTPLINEIANCVPEFLYFQYNKITDESWYFVRINFPYGQKTIKSTFSGAQIASATEFKKRLLTVGPGALYTGSQRHLDWFVKNTLKNIKTVQTVDFVGYDKDTGTYIFPDFAFSKGKYYEKNNEEYFDISDTAIKTLNKNYKLVVGDEKNYRSNWLRLVFEAFGAKGIVCVVHWFGILFAEQIRKNQHSYPFLEIVGEAGSGKTTLIEFLWKLIGRDDEEGFDPSKSTAAAVSRKFSQVSNLPVVLIEGDRDQNQNNYKKFDWDELKTAYNGRATRSRGYKNSGNETMDPLFKGGLVISQNNEVVASEAILQRIIHINLDRKNHNQDTKEAVDELMALSTEDISYFLRLALQKEEQIIQTIFEYVPIFEKELLKNSKINSIRIAKNHAQLLSIGKAFFKLVNAEELIIEEFNVFALNMAIDRNKAIEADHPLIEQFWETFEYLNNKNDGKNLDHSKNDNFIAVNLNHFLQMAGEHKQQVPLMSDLKKHLPYSKNRKLIESNKGIRSDIHDNKVIKCWIFENKDSEGNNNE